MSASRRPRGVGALLCITLGVISLATGFASAIAAPAEAPRAFERAGRSGSIPTTSPARATPPAKTLANLVVVDDSWTGFLNGTVVTVGANNYVIGTDAFATVQDGIDAVGPGGTVQVLPGTYSETAAGRLLYDSSGPYQFGLFFEAAKPGVTVEGVDASGNPITSSGAVLATINTNATNGFGPSGVFVEGDGVTLAGVRVGTNSAGQNKTIEVIGDDFRLEWCDLADLGGSVYINDFRFDSSTNTSHVTSYRSRATTSRTDWSLHIGERRGLQRPGQRTRRHRQRRSR